MNISYLIRVRCLVISFAILLLNLLKYYKSVGWMEEGEATGSNITVETAL